MIISRKKEKKKKKLFIFLWCVGVDMGWRESFISLNQRHYWNDTQKNTKKHTKKTEKTWKGGWEMWLTGGDHTINYFITTLNSERRDTSCPIINSFTLVSKHTQEASRSESNQPFELWRCALDRLADLLKVRDVHIHLFCRSLFVSIHV